MTFQMSSSDEELFDVDDEFINEQRAIEESIEQINDDNLKVALELSQAENLKRIRNNVFDRINSTFGDDINNLHKVNDLHEELLEKLDILDKKLNVANTEAPSQLHKSLRKGGCGTIIHQQFYQLSS